MCKRPHSSPVFGAGCVVLAACTALVPAATSSASADAFDHRYAAYANLLRAHVVGSRVDYLKLQRNRSILDAVVDELGRVSATDFADWTDEQQISYWINAYNAFTLQSIVDHYPIERRWLNWTGLLAPTNSIKQISGIWTRLHWRAAGVDMTLDEIEHETLRVDYDEPRIHFAVNYAAVSCPPLRREPYTAARLDRQLIVAASDFLKSRIGLQVDGSTLHVSSIFNWFGDDFIDEYGHLVDTNLSSKARAALGVVAKYGPPEASRLAQSGTARLRFLKYDWSLNDTAAE